MSEDTTATATDTTTETTEAAKAREPKKNSISAERIAKLVEGIPSYSKTSFLVVGHKDGVRVALPKTSGVSRAYFYGNGDYSLVPSHDAITVFTEEQRKEQRKGGIMAEVDFAKGTELAWSALEALFEVVRNAKAPVAKPVRVKAPKKEKAVAAPQADQAADHGGGMAGHDTDTDGDEAPVEA